MSTSTSYTLGRPSSIILSITLDRVSLSILESHPAAITSSAHKNGHIKKHSLPNALLSFGLYGFNCVSNDLSIDAKLKSVQLVDSRGNTVLSCGVTDDYDGDNSIDADVAFSFTLDFVEYAIATSNSNTEKSKRFTGESFEIDEQSLMAEQISKSINRLQQLAVFAVSSNKQKSTDVFTDFKTQYANASTTRQHAISAIRINLIKIILENTFLSTISSLSSILKTHSDITKLRVKQSNDNHSTLVLPKIVAVVDASNKTKVSLDVLSEGLLILVPVSSSHKSVIVEPLSDTHQPQSSSSSSLGPCLVLKTGKWVLLSGDNLGGWIASDGLSHTQSFKRYNTLTDTFRTKLDEFTTASASDTYTSRVPMWSRYNSQQQTARRTKRRQENSTYQYANQPADDTDTGETNASISSREDEPQLQWDEIERNIKLTARKVCADGDAPFIFSVSKVELGFINNTTTATTTTTTDIKSIGLSTSMLEKPIQVSGLFYSSTHLSISTRVDTFVSTIAVTVSFDDLLRAGDIARQLNESLLHSGSNIQPIPTSDMATTQSSIYTHTNTGQSIYSLSIPKLKFVLLSREISDSIDKCRECLEVYISTVLSMRYSPRSVLTAQKVAVYQLESLGVLSSAAEEALHQAFITATASSQRIDTIVTEFTNILEGFITHTANQKQRNYLPLCCANIHKIQLRYDISGSVSQLGLGFESLLINDKEGVPLFNMQPEDRISEYSAYEDSIHDGILEINQHLRRHSRPLSPRQEVITQSTYLQNRPLTSMNTFKTESETKYQSPTCHHISSLHPHLLIVSENMKNPLCDSSKALSLFLREDFSDNTRQILIQLATVDVMYYSFAQSEMVSEVLKMFSELKRRYCIDSTATNTNAKNAINGPSVRFGDELNDNNNITQSSIHHTPIRTRSSSPSVRQSFDTTNSRRIPVSHMKSNLITKSTPRTFTSMAIATKAININVGYDKKLLAQLCLHNTMISVCTDEVSNKLNDTQRLASVGGSISEIGLYDMSLPGCIHSKVLWCLKSEDSPVILFDVNKDDILTHFHGLRCCFVNRFIQELSSLLSDNIVSPLIQIFADLDTQMHSESSPNHGNNSSFHTDKSQGISQLDDIQEALSSIGSVLSSDSFDDDDGSESDYSDDQKSSSDSSKDLEVDVLRSANDMRAKIKASGHYSAAQMNSRLHPLNESKQSLQFESQSCTGSPQPQSPTRDNMNKFNSKSSFQLQPTRDIWKLDMIDFIVYLPRNTCSLDLVAVVVGSSLVQGRRVYSSWEEPKDTIECKSSNSFLFDPDRNKWRHIHDDEVYYSNVKKYISPFDIESKLVHDQHHQKKRDDEYSYSELKTSRSINDESQNTSYSRTIFTMNDVKVFVSLSGALTNFDGSSRTDISIGDELTPMEVINREDVYSRRKRKTDQQVIYKQQVWREVTTEAFNVTVLADCNPKEYRFIFTDTSDVSTLSLNLSMAELYLLMSLWYDNMSEKLQYIVSTSSDDRELLRTNSELLASKAELYLPKYGTPDYFEFLRSRPSSWAVTFVRSELIIRSFVDYQYFVKEPDCLKLLLASFGSTNSSGQLDEDMKLFFSASNDYGYNGATDGRSGADLETRNLNTTRSDLNMNNTNTSRVNPLIWDNIALPVAEIILSGLVLYTTGGRDVSSTSLTSSVVELWDIRKPACAPRPYSLLLKIGTHRTRRRSNASHPSQHGRQHKDKINHRKYIAPDLNYGMNLHSSDIESSSVFIEKGLYLSSIYSSSSNWATSHVGVYSPECSLPNIEVVALLQEYFGAYFWSPEYGSPVVNAYTALEKSFTETGEEIPYGGYDFRLFLFKPVLSIPEKPTDPESQILFLETDKGVYFRVSQDTLFNVNYQVNVSGLAMVVSKTPMIPALCRGVRGAAGSGRGIRTLLEYLSLSFSYSYHQDTGSVDIFIDVFPTPETYTPDINDSMLAIQLGSSHVFPSIGNRGPFIEMSQSRSHLTFYPIALPTAVRPIISPGSESNNMESCDVVTSLEDLYFLRYVAQTFLGYHQQQPQQQAVAVNNSNNINVTTESSSSSSTPINIKSMYVVASLAYVKFVLVDNLLGLHLPLMQVCVNLYYYISTHLYLYLYL